MPFSPPLSLLRKIQENRGIKAANSARATSQQHEDGRDIGGWMSRLFESVIKREGAIKRTSAPCDRWTVITYHVRVAFARSR